MRPSHLKFILPLLMIPTLVYAEIPVSIQKLIQKGKFTQAQRSLCELLNADKAIAATDKLELKFEIERLDRIKLDFTKTRDDILPYIQQYIPAVSDKDLAKWEKERSLEYMIIDGEKRYFKYGHYNLFRIDEKAKAAKQNVNALSSTESDDEYCRLSYITKLCESPPSTKYFAPQRFRITYTLDVDADAVPAGKVIRCWLPYPRNIENRQTDIKLISTEPSAHIVADNRHLQRTVYLEKIARSNEVTHFSLQFEYTNYAVHVPIYSDSVLLTPKTEALKPYLSERPPHIIFTPAIKKLSAKIVGNEKNPYRIAQRLFEWIHANIPWASAREYSTFYNIPAYVLENRHADCGMKSLFFITLCRLNGIPARWQSGWRTEPGFKGMHDWGEIYFEPYGWVPMDPDNGLLESDDEHVKWFYLSGMDAYRLIVNDDYSQNLYPAKMHFRSETIDFQRGEVEWEGGNLYFNQWDYTYSAEKIPLN